MQALDFIETARHLTTSSSGRPRQSDLRRAVSTAYYALFHCLAICCADMLVGGPGANRSEAAWRQAYRALNHGHAKKRCAQQRIVEFPNEIQDLASAFVDMQRKRHTADYDPDAAFSKNEVIQSISEAEDVIRGFAQAPRRDRRAFAVYLLFDSRG